MADTPNFLPLVLPPGAFTNPVPFNSTTPFYNPQGYAPGSQSLTPSPPGGPQMGQAGSPAPSPGQSATSTGFTGFPNFNIPGLNFPFSSLPQQASAAFAPMQFSNGSQYGRWNGVNNNAFGLFPNQFGPLFGYQPMGGGMQFQPPYGNNGGSNSGPGSNPNLPSGQMPQLPSPTAQPMSGGITPPSIPSNVTPNNTGFATNFAPTGGNAFSQQMQHALASGRLTGPMATSYSQMPTSFSPAQFNQVAQQNPVLAEAMAGQMGQSGRNAIMAQNGWSNEDMNRFLNAYGSGAQPGFNAQAMSLLSSLGIR